MADKLTPQQHQAVFDRGGNLLVSAAAGSGKTKVLVDRLMTYLTDPQAPADLDEFLIITYTKAAASELRGKIAAKLTERIAQEPHNRHLQKQVQRLFLTKISTVHGFCGDLLREYPYRLDIAADFRIADENECSEIRTQVLTDLLDKAYMDHAEDPDFRAFVDSQGLGRTDKHVPQIIEKVYDSARCHLDPEKWLDDCLKSAAVEDIADASHTLWGKYLMDDLVGYLDEQIAAFGICCERAEEFPEFEKVTINLRATLLHLETLRNCSSWDEVVTNRNVQYGRLVFPKKNPDLNLTDRIKAVRNACKKGLDKKLQSFSDTSDVVLQDLQQVSSGVRGLVALVRQFGKDYSHVKRSRRCLDFGDLEHKTLDLLLGKSRSGPTQAASEVASRYREIMVDEYQDSNGVQDAIFEALTRERHNCFMVGDVKQSIYQFRLADPGIFLEKYHAYTPATKALPGQGRKVMLSHNFRSGGEVIDAVNDVFHCCMGPRVGGLVYGEDEALREGIPHEALPDAAVELYAVEVQEETYPEEAEFVAQKIRDMLQNKTLIRRDGGLYPVREEDIVILLRSPGSGGQYFLRALEKYGIRCSSGSGLDLLNTQEVSTLRSLLQTIQNPRQDIPLISVLASPIFGFTADDLARIRSKQKIGSFYDAILLDESQKTQNFLSILSHLRDQAQMYGLSLLLEQCYCVTRIDSIYRAMDGGEAKAANLQLFYQLAMDFEKGNYRDLSQFLDHLTALEGRGIPASGGAGSGCVTIMSIHKSKGLEFPVVFLCNLSRKFNTESLRDQILCDKSQGMGLSIANANQRIRYPSIAKRAISVKMAAESISEEMRVLYVALTRARDRLIMTYASRTLAADLQDLALRQDFQKGELLSRDAACPGDWILQCALGKTEAGALHGISDRPAETKLSVFPWKIDVVQVAGQQTAVTIAEDVTEKVPEEIFQRLKNRMNFVYPHMAASHSPSKQTATGRKGREKDEEAAQHAGYPKQIYRTWRKPSFVEAEKSSVDYGNALHLAMQFLRYEKCTDKAGVEAELQRLAEGKFISEDQLAMIDSQQIVNFFQSELGQKLRNGASCIREFKFSILDDGVYYDTAIAQESVLLQGVVDCALIEDDGIIVLDFKSDRVTEMNYHHAVERYRTQIEAYAHALAKIYQKPVKKSLIYFFRINKFVEIE